MELQLYYFPECPFCQLVLDKIEELNLRVELKNIRKDQEAFDKLVQDTGKRTVPCLYINGTPKHESAEIVAWIDENKADLPKN